MKLPAGSKTMTGGAAIEKSGSLSVRGRCNSQTLSCASTAKLDASPTLYWGGTFGQTLSTSNVGSARVVWAAAGAPKSPYPAPAPTNDAIRTARPKQKRFMLTSRGLLVV